MREAPHRFDLTPRQREVLDLMARGLTNYEIAEALGVSLSGAKWHVSEVLSKLGVASREEAAAFWRTYNRPTARLSRAARGLLALPALKLAGAAVVGSVALFVCTAAITATFGSDDPYGSDAQLLVGPHVVRQVFSESTESEGRLQEVIGDAYVLVGALANQSRLPVATTVLRVNSNNFGTWTLRANGLTYRAEQTKPVW